MGSEWSNSQKLTDGVKQPEWLRVVDGCEWFVHTKILHRCLCFRWKFYRLLHFRLTFSQVVSDGNSTWVVVFQSDSDECRWFIHGHSTWVVVFQSDSDGWGWFVHGNSTWVDFAEARRGRSGLQ